MLWLPCEPTERTTTARRFNAFKCKPRAHAPLEEEETDDDSLGYEDDFSSGIDLPMTLDVTSGASKICQEMLFFLCVIIRANHDLLRSGADYPYA